MKEWTMYVPIILVCIPILMTILFYQVHYRMNKNQWRAIHFTVQFSFIFYIIADTILFNWILHKNLLGIFVFLLFIFIYFIIIILVYIPILMIIHFYQIHYRMNKNQWRAIHFTVQFSFIFYIIADTILFNWILHKNLLGIFAIFLIILLSIILIIQRKLKMEIDLKQGIVSLMRVSFLIFSILYVILLLYVVIVGYVT